MKRLSSALAALTFASLTLGLGPAFSTTARADDTVRAVQQALHDEGFYLGEITGEPSNDLTAAIKRFQLRNGMQGTGQLTDEVLQALNIGGAPEPAPTVPPPAPRGRGQEPIPGLEPGAQPEQQNPPPSTRGGSQRSAPQFPPGGRQPQLEAPSPRGGFQQPPPGSQRGGFQPPPEPGPDARANPQPAGSAPNPVYGEIFWGTPYAVAPEEVQRRTVIECQKLLKSHNVYRGNIDGQPGPKMTDALRWFQQNSAKIPVTGRMDMPTLSALHLLPGGPAGPRIQPYSNPGGPGGAPPRGPTRPAPREGNF